MATEVLRAHNVILPPQQQHRVRAGHQKPAGPAAGSRKQPAAAGRRQRLRKVAAVARRAAAEVYAGPAFSTSPEPSALPLPQFIPVKKAVVDDAATRDLRRILRLE